MDFASSSARSSIFSAATIVLRFALLHLEQRDERSTDENAPATLTPRQRPIEDVSDQTEKTFAIYSIERTRGLERIDQSRITPPRGE